MKSVIHYSLEKPCSDILSERCSRVNNDVGRGTAVMIILQTCYDLTPLYRSDICTQTNSLKKKKHDLDYI